MAAQSILQTSLSRNPPRRVPFDLRDLFTALELQEIADKHRVGILDSAMEEIVASPQARNWCRIISNGGPSDVNCANCAAEARLSSREYGEVGWTTCANGLERLLIPIRCYGHVIGWVTGRPFVAAKIGPLIEDIGDKRLRNEAEFLNTPISRHDIEESTSHAHEDLVPKCGERRRKAIMEKARQAVLDAKEIETVHTALFSGIQDLYGDLKAVHLYEVHRDLGGECYRLVKSDGSEAQADDYRLPRKKTHLGVSIANARPYYVARLGKDDPDFVHTSSAPRPKSVFTIPMKLGAQAAPAALQMQSNREDFFSKEIDREVAIQLAVLAASVASKIALRKEIAAADLRAEKANSWNDFVVGILLDNTWSRFDILKKKQAVYSQFVEQLRAVAGVDCIGTSVRLINTLTEIMGFVAASGAGFTPERMQKQYSPRLKGAAFKAMLEGHLYYQDVTERNDYYKLIPETRSLWIKRFHVHGEAVGIVAVDWKETGRCSPEMHEQFCSLITQFERVLEVLTDRQELLVANMQSPVSHGSDLDDAVRPLVKDLKVLFEARACSLFLDRRNQRVLTLQATTNPGQGHESYRFGFGITGWVAEHKKTVRIRHTGDKGELRTIQKLHGISQLLSHADNYKENIDYGSARKLSFLAAPLVARGRVLGVVRLTVKNNEAQEFTHQDESFLQEIANKMAHAMDVRWLAEDTDLQLREMEREANFREQLRLAAGLPEVCQVLSDQFMHRTHARGAHLLVSDEEEPLQAQVASGVLKLLLTLPTYPELPPEASSDSIWIDSRWTPLCSALKEHLSALADELVQAAVSIPLPMTGATARLVLVWQSPQHTRKAFNRDIADLKESLEASLNQARIQRRQKDTNEELERLQQVAIACGERRSLTEICVKILSVALSEARLDRGTIRLRGTDDDWVMYARTGPKADEVPSAIKTNYGLSRCLSAKEPFVIESADEAWKQYLASLAPGMRRNYLEELSYLVVVPLYQDAQCLGAIILKSISPSPIPARGLHFLRTLGSYASVAIRSLQLHEKELEARPIELLGAMLGGFLHTMRNKANNAMMSLGVLESEKLPLEERTHWMTSLKNDLARIKDVCENLKLFAGGVDNKHSGVPVNDIFAQVWEDMPNDLKASVETHLKLDPKQPQVQGNVTPDQCIISPCP